MDESRASPIDVIWVEKVLNFQSSGWVIRNIVVRGDVVKACPLLDQLMEPFYPVCYKPIDG